MLVFSLLIGPPSWADQPASARLTDLDARINLHPHDVPTRLIRAQVRLDAGMPLEALTDLAVVTEQNPEEPRMLLLRAEALVSLGSEEFAMTDINLRIEVGPVSARAHDLRSYLHENRGDNLAALTDALAALNIAPTPERALTAAALATVEQGPGEAGAICSRSADLMGGAVSLRLAAVGYYRADDRPDLALSQIQMLLKTSPGHPDWLILQSRVLDESGRAAEAQSVRLRALQRLDELLSTRPTPARRKAHAALAAELQGQP
jgi:tetratricopeptide (TPR) repeat protein